MADECKPDDEVVKFSREVIVMLEKILQSYIDYPSPAAGSITRAIFGTVAQIVYKAISVMQRIGKRIEDDGDNTTWH